MPNMKKFHVDVPRMDIEIDDELREELDEMKKELEEMRKELKELKK